MDAPTKAEVEDALGREMRISERIVFAIFSLEAALFGDEEK